MKNRNMLLILIALALLVTLSPLSGDMALAASADQVTSRLSNQPVFGSEMPGSDPTATARLQTAASQLPLSFVPNAGQMDPTVRFQVRSAGATLFFTSNEIVLSLPTRTAADLSEIRNPPSAVRDPQPAISNSRAIVRLVFEQANPAPEISAANPLPGTVNYFSGNDPEQWHTNLPTYAGVVYRQLYPGIDLHYDGANRSLKATYLVAPGADPALIRWGYDGANLVRVEEASGDLLVQVPASGEGNETIELREQAPVAWQTVADQRLPVTAMYEIREDGTVGFVFPGGFDRNRPLTIDPILFFSTYLGGGGKDAGQSVALDLSGNIYVAGYTSSQDFPTPNGFQTSHNVTSHAAFVTKYNPDATAIVYSTYLGGWSLGSPFFGDVFGQSLAVDLFGSAYLTGYTANTHFPTTLGAFQTAFNAGSTYDAFVTKLSPDGNALVYSTYLGGAGEDIGLAIGLDLSGAAYVTGSTTSGGFPTSPTAYQTNLRGSQDAFVTKLKPDGLGIAYSTYLGGTGTETGRAIAVDFFLGNAYIAGDTVSSTSFPLSNAYQSSFGGGKDAFVTKLNAEGSQLIFSTFLGGDLSDSARGIAFDVQGNLYLTGVTDSTNFPLQNPIQAAIGVSPDAFVSKLNAAGSALFYSTYLGGNGEDHGTAIALDGSANAYVTGFTNSTNFPLEKPFSSTYGGNFDAFLTTVNTAGSAFLHSSYIGGNTYDEGWGIAVDVGGVAYITGSTGGNFYSLSAFQPFYGGGNSDAFLMKLGKAATTTTIISSAPNPSNEGQAVTVNFAIATTTPGTGVPTGTVTVSDGTINCLAALPATSCNLTFASPGVRNLTAAYAGDANFNPSTSPAVAQTVNNLVPTITSISPTWSAVGGPGFTLTVNGTNFFDGTTVRWNGSDRLTTFVNSTQLTAFIPATDLKTVGTVSITVAHPGPTGDVSNAMTQKVSVGLFLPLILR